MKKKFIFLIPLAFVLFINLYFRAFPIYFPQFKTQAKNIVLNGIRQAITQEVFKRYPQYDPLAKERLINTHFAQYLKQNASEIEKQIKNLYLKFKEKYQDETGQTYLMELDCWHWSRYVENVFLRGYPGDMVIKGKQFDRLMLSPSGMQLSWDNFLYYFSAYLYKIFLFFKYVPLFTFLFYLPLFFIFLFIMGLYFFSFTQGKYIGALISCLFIGLSTSFIPRSCAGWFDKDILNLLFPVLIIWVYLLNYKASSFRQKLFWIFFSCFWIGLFCFTWTMWWFVFVIILAYEFLHIFIQLIIYGYYKKDYRAFPKEHIINFLLFIFFSFFWIIILCGFEPLVVLFNQLKSAIFLSKPLRESIWPNVYATVGELKKMSLQEIVNSFGNAGLFFSAFLSLLFILIRNLFYHPEDEYKRHSIGILTLWFLGMLYASFQGVRFLVFLTVPLGIALGRFINDIYEYIKIKFGFLKSVLISGCLVIIFSSQFFNNANRVSRGIFPLMDDQWYKVLTLLRDTTPKEAVINSWWDFGDWFKVVAKRRVIFDGQTQNKPQAYWMAKAILSENEEEALGILRMLNNGGNQAFEIINEYLKDPLAAVLLLERVLGLSYYEAKDILEDFLPTRTTQELLSLLFDKTVPIYFIVDYSMVYKISAISFLGNWNFAKVYIVKNFNKEEKEKILERLVKLGKDSSLMQRFYQEAFLISSQNIDTWLSQVLQFYSEPVRGTLKDNLVYFENGFIYNPKEKTIYTNSGQIPRSLFFIEDDQIKERVYLNANQIFSILVYQIQPEIYKAILLDQALGKSLFVRLYFLRGKTLKHFKPHIEAEEANNFIGSFWVEQ